MFWCLVFLSQSLVWSLLRVSFLTLFLLSSLWLPFSLTHFPSISVHSVPHPSPLSAPSLYVFLWSTLTLPSATTSVHPCVSSLACSFWVLMCYPLFFSCTHIFFLQCSPAPIFPGSSDSCSVCSLRWTTERCRTDIHQRPPMMDAAQHSSSHLAPGAAACIQIQTLMLHYCPIVSGRQNPICVLKTRPSLGLLYHVPNNVSHMYCIVPSPIITEYWKTHAPFLLIQHGLIAWTAAILLNVKM